MNQGISIFPNTGLCAIACGLAIAFLALERPRVGLARFFAGFVALLAGLTLIEHLTGMNLGIDTLLLNRPWGQTAAAAPMRMGVPASTSFLLLGIAGLLATASGKWLSIAAALPILTTAIALLSLTGYWFGADQLFGIARFTGIALLASMVIAALSAGMMAVLPDRGLAAALRRDDAGGAMLRRLVIPIICFPFALGWARILGEQASLFDPAFGTSLRTLAEIFVYFALIWWTANHVSQHATSAHKAESRLAAIVESSEDAIVSKSLTGIIESWNAGAERVFGYQAAEAVGKHISLLIPADRLQEEEVIISKLRRGERVEHFETVRVRKDGALINVSLTISPVRNPRGEVIGASKIARDVTVRKELEQRREDLLEHERRAREEAERVSQLKDEFLATLSHELRTPLNAILGWSQILGPTSEVDALKEGLDAIERNGRAQAQLIEDLLDMSRIVSGRVRLDVQTVELAPLIEAALESVRPASVAKEIRLTSVLNPHVGAVSGDPTRLQQVVWNLLANAIKFTPKGGRVSVTLRQVNSHVEIIVHDTGIGIAPENLGLIFERFRQVDSSSTRLHGGLGLGLSIVKQLVELHGGVVEAHSPGAGQGATFTVSLPLSPLRRSEIKDPESGRSSILDERKVNLDGVRVLVVDDEPDARALIQRILRKYGAEVRLADSASAGIDALRAFRPHVLISDVGMPEIDGYQFMRAIRELDEQHGGRTPAIALTAFARSEDRMRAILAGYQVHVAKPIEPQELAVMVAALTRGISAPQA